MKRLTQIMTLTISLVLLLTLFTPALAQGEEKAAPQPAGISILILLMGILALLIVGGAYLSQGGGKPANGTAGARSGEDEEV